MKKKSKRSSGYFSTTYSMPPCVKLYFDSVLFYNITPPHEKLLEEARKWLPIAVKKYAKCPKKIKIFEELCKQVELEYGRKEAVKDLVRAKKKALDETHKKRPNFSTGAFFMFSPRPQNRN